MRSPGVNRSSSKPSSKPSSKQSRQQRTERPLMITIRPVPRALAPVDSAAAERISAPNYDEFQSEREIWELLQRRPQAVLRVTMAHCHTDRFEDVLPDGSEAALAKAAEEMARFRESRDTRSVEDILWVYEIVSPRRPELRQIGLGGYARTAEIRTDETPDGTIVRNEGIRPDKAEGRARLIAATDAYIGTVNCAVRDRSGEMTQALQAHADARSADFETPDEAGNRHRVWLVQDPADVDRFVQLLANEPAAYVADGNHRSAAAAALGREHFLAAFFPTDRLHLEPYNRLLPGCGVSAEAMLERVAGAFDVTSLGDLPGFRPEAVHEIGLYCKSGWYRLVPKPGAFDETDAAASIDAAIVQEHILDGVLGLTDARDSRINYVGGNKDASYLKSRVDSGEFAFALSLAPVTMDQFIAVCEQGRFMPPKSTWFDPKIRSGLVSALL
ncbi:MAG: DUF1015 domain-containing protein [Planctomycetota bacterium]|nr:MAG: DUF1015 domain-containing protein [Planctomycetota bacterium]REK38099.1 MAG: DUF1015 domain-containing protein [Planctomycetota bacterium]